jgi:hypothetical protein
LSIRLDAAKCEVTNRESSNTVDRNLLVAWGWNLQSAEPVAVVRQSRKLFGDGIYEQLYWFLLVWTAPGGIESGPE